MKKYLLFFIWALFFIKAQAQESQDVALRWADQTVKFIHIQQGKSPTFVSWCLGYSGLTMYESVVNRNPKYRSMAGQLNGLKILPKPKKGKKYDWPTVLNASQLLILNLIWQPKKHYMNNFLTREIEQLAAEIEKEKLAITKNI